MYKSIREAYAKIAPVIKPKRNNKTIGSQFEKDIIEYFYQRGYWVHFLNPAPDGSQPCDIIAARDKDVIFIDCKTIEGKRFPLSRIEDNQEMAFRSILAKTSHRVCFVLQVEEGKAMFVDGRHLLDMKSDGIKSASISELADTYAIITIKQDNDTECNS